MRVPIIKQHDLTDCAPACLASVIKHYGGYVPIELLRNSCKTDLNGTYAIDLINAAKKYGFSAYAKKVDVTCFENKEEKTPLIMHVKYKNGLFHYLVLYKVKNNKFIFMDPAKGKIVLSKDKVKEIFTGVIILLHPETNIMSYQKPQTLKKIIVNIATQNKKNILKMIFYGSSIIIVSIILSYYIKISSQYEEMRSTLSLYIVISIFGILTFIKIMLNYLKNNTQIKLNTSINNELLKSYFHQLFILPLNFIRSKKNGEIISRFEELNNFSSFLSDSITTFILDLIMIIISFVFMYFLSVKLSIVVMIFILLYVLLCLILKNPTLKNVDELVEKSTNLNTSLINTVNLLVSIKYLHGEKNLEKRLNDNKDEYLNQDYRLSKFISFCHLLKDFLYEYFTWFILSLGIIYVKKGSISLIDLFTFTLVINYITEPLKEILDMIPDICYIKSSLNKLSEFMIIEKNAFGKYPFITGKLSIKNLSYNYNEYNKVLNNFNLDINPGEKILLKGSSGCGKSTLCQIISGQIDNYSGNVLINETNIKDISEKSYKENIIYIGQKDSLLNDSIWNNIKFERNIDEEKIKNICRICEIDKIISKKFDRYDAVINEFSNNLSGGEKQRIILARGLVEQKPIIILDEALSELNNDLEIKILNEIFNLYRDSTFIVVSHKKYPKIFDKIINLQPKEISV